jgi:hypothetical protein
MYNSSSLVYTVVITTKPDKSYASNRMKYQYTSEAYH